MGILIGESLRKRTTISDETPALRLSLEKRGTLRSKLTGRTGKKDTFESEINDFKLSIYPFENLRS